MMPAKLIKSLEKYGFELEFPGYNSNEEMIIEILKQKNERLSLSIPLLLSDGFDYKNIKKKLEPSLIKEFDHIILITEKIFRLENIENMNISNIIKENKIKARIYGKRFEYFYDSFKHFSKNKETSEEKSIKGQIEIRGKLNTNIALSKIFAPGKRRIMGKIFNHEHLTNTELKYYYRSIRPLILSILNENMQKYLRIIESIKKLRE